MGIQSIGDGFKKTLQNTVDKAKEKGQDIELLDVKEVGKNATKQVKNSLQEAVKIVQNIEVADMKEAGEKATKQIKESLQGTVKAVSNVELPDLKQAGTDVTNQAKDFINKVSRSQTTIDQESEKDHDILYVSSKNAIKIIYFLMAADGKIYQGEEEKFAAVGIELDPMFHKSRSQIVKECDRYLKKVSDSSDYYKVLQAGVEKALESGSKHSNSEIPTKVLVWDLLSVAYSDGAYDDIEHDLIEYVVKKCRVEQSVFVEMESSMLTLRDLEKELEWIKTIDRPYLEIENIVKEIEYRKKVITDSVYDLISL